MTTTSTRNGHRLLVLLLAALAAFAGLSARPRSARAETHHAAHAAGSAEKTAAAGEKPDTEHAPARAEGEAAAADEGAAATDGEAAAPPAAPVAAGPVTMKLALVLEKIAKLELGPGTFNAEFYLSVTCSHEPCKPDFTVTNGKITNKELVVDEKLHKEWRVRAELEAFIDLAEFPFDNHVLYVSFADKGDPFGVVYEIDKSKSEIDSNVKLAGWSLGKALETHVEAHDIAGQKAHEATFALEIERPRVSATFKSLVPVFFMVFVAGFTLILKPKSAAGRLSTATGGLMSAVMFHLSSTSSLPPMGYLTRMDKFMLATYVVYLVNIALSVGMVRFEEKKREKWSELCYLVAGGAVPGVALVAWVVVFTRLV